MVTFNRGSFIGVVADEPARFDVAGKRPLKFKVLVESGWGAKKFHQAIQCTVWYDRLAGDIEHTVRKGYEVYIEGEVSARGWMGNDGKARGSLELRLSDLKLISAGVSADFDAAAPTDAERVDDLPY